jgi:DNA-3-methyladenine glycosylase
MLESLEKLPRSFYLRATKTVARDLLGKYLIRRWERVLLIGRIVEVEAYLGSHDPASHAYHGPTRRNSVMFRQGGHLYVYFTYGMHFCCNIVTEGEGTGHAVLLRAVEPVRGAPVMARLRGLGDPGTDDAPLPSSVLVSLCNGPGKVCQAFGIGRMHNGTDLCGTTIWIAGASPSVPVRIATSTRIGIRKGEKHRWRYFLKDNPFVSKGRPVVPAPEPA